MFCPNCGKETNAKFCPECGTEVNAELKTAEPTPSQPKTVIKVKKSDFCKGCGSYLGPNVVVCPRCGKKVPTRKSKDIKLVITIVSIIIGIVIIANIFGEDSTNDVPTSAQPAATSSETQSSKASSKTEEIIDVDYNVLYDEYKENEIAADQKYKGKKLKLTGQISRIGQDIINTPYIIIEVKTFDGIRLDFKSSEKEKLANLSTGQTITVIGKCKGKIILDVNLEDCVICD